MKGKKLQKGKFTISGENVYIGYHDPEKLWNDFNTPMFEWEEALKIAQAFDAIEADQTKKMIKTVDDEFDPYPIYSKEYQTEDGKKKLYSIGTASWQWKEV